MLIRAVPNGRPIPPHSFLVAIDRNQWSSSTGTGGRLQPKQLVVIDRNRWSSSIETTGRLQPKQLVAISRCAHDTAGPAGMRREIVCDEIAKQAGVER